MLRPLDVAHCWLLHQLSHLCLRTRWCFACLASLRLSFWKAAWRWDLFWRKFRWTVSLINLMDWLPVVLLELDLLLLWLNDSLRHQVCCLQEQSLCLRRDDFERLIPTSARFRRTTYWLYRSRLLPPSYLKCTEELNNETFLGLQYPKLRFAPFCRPQLCSLWESQCQLLPTLIQWWQRFNLPFICRRRCLMRSVVL